MIFNFKTKVDKTEWHKWFVWFPIIVNHEDSHKAGEVLVWLETIERKVKYTPVGIIFKYRIPNEIKTVINTGVR